MEPKRILIGTVLVLGGLIILSSFGLVPNFFTPGTSEEQGEVVIYTSSEHGLAFGYPATYELREFPLTNEGVTWTAVTLADREVLREAEEHGASEGPPLIAVQIFTNAENLSAADWVQTSMFSNFNLSINGQMGTTTVGGVEAVGYIYSGLFATDVVVVAHNAKIYMFLVDWITEEDENRRMFDAILESVQFI